jgi:PAB1-binding protein PBP1
VQTVGGFGFTIYSFSQRSYPGFRTDTDISNTNASGNPKERELQQWQPEPAGATAASLAALQGDEATFGVPGVYSAIPWDQFEVNERLFGVNPKFDEEAYTTKLDRSAPGYKEKERKAEQIANEIISVCGLASLRTFFCSHPIF